MIKFPCTKCGACCKRAGESGLMPAKKDGSCIYLNKDNTCSIYNKRPDICNLDKLYKHLKLQGAKLHGVFSPKMSKKEWYIKNAEACNKFIEEDGLDKKYKIDINSI
jgi:Fe-S-cluster containining protein